MTTIFINTKRVNGKSDHYPMCEISALLSEIGKEDDTVIFRLTSRDLRLITALGFKVEYVLDGNADEYDYDKIDYLKRINKEKAPYKKNEFKFRGGF